MKLTFKFAMRIIHGSHCSLKFSLAYCKQELHTSWFSITLIKQTINKESVILILELKKLDIKPADKNVNMAMKLTATKRQSYMACEKLRIIELCWPAVETFLNLS